jgi:undecaprenyl pyrophosphate synthase
LLVLTFRRQEYKSLLAGSQTAAGKHLNSGVKILKDINRRWLKARLLQKSSFHRNDNKF